MRFVLFALFPSTHGRHVFKKNAELYDVNAVPFPSAAASPSDTTSCSPEGDGSSGAGSEQPDGEPGADFHLVVLACSPAYPLARLKFPARLRFGVAIFVTYLVPPSFCSTAQHGWRLGLSEVSGALSHTDSSSFCPGSSWATSARCEGIGVRHARRVQPLQTMLRILLRWGARRHLRRPCSPSTSRGTSS